MSPRFVERPIRWLAGATFTLYLLYVPVAQFLASLSPWQQGTVPERILVFGGTFGLVFLVVEHTERRKTVWREVVGRVSALKRRSLST